MSGILSTPVFDHLSRADWGTEDKLVDPDTRNLTPPTLTYINLPPPGSIVAEARIVQLFDGREESGGLSNDKDNDVGRHGCARISTTTSAFIPPLAGQVGGCMSLRLCTSAPRCGQLVTLCRRAR